eukprot:scaffold37951_cov66-Phaeocystis_antarctica.AAC.4
MTPVAKHKGAPNHSCSHPNQPPHHLPSTPPRLHSTGASHARAAVPHCTTLPPSPACPIPPTPAPIPLTVSKKRHCERDFVKPVSAVPS